MKALALLALLLLPGCSVPWYDPARDPTVLDDCATEVCG